VYIDESQSVDGAGKVRQTEEHRTCLQYQRGDRDSAEECSGGRMRYKWNDDEIRNYQRIRA
jgi:hypothetical protein